MVAVTSRSVLDCVKTLLSRSAQQAPKQTSVLIHANFPILTQTQREGEQKARFLTEYPLVGQACKFPVVKSLSTYAHTCTHHQHDFDFSNTAANPLHPRDSSHAVLPCYASVSRRAFHSNWQNHKSMVWQLWHSKIQLSSQGTSRYCHLIFKSPPGIKWKPGIRISAFSIH